MSPFFEGISFFWKALKILKTDRSVRLLSLFPIFIFMILLVTGLVFGIFYIDNILNLFFFDYLQSLHGFFRGLVYLLGFFLFGLFFYFFVFVITALVSIPICNTICDQVIRKHTTLALPEKSLKQEIISAFKMLKSAIGKIFLLVGIGALLFIAGFLPVLSPLVFYMTVMVITFDCMDYAFEKYDYGLRKRLKFIKTHLGQFLGLAFVHVFVLMIPLLQFAILPLAVCSTTLMFCKLHKKEHT